MNHTTMGNNSYPLSARVMHGSSIYLTANYWADHGASADAAST
jgi:hypothetical protein